MECFPHHIKCVLSSSRHYLFVVGLAHVVPCRLDAPAFFGCLVEKKDAGQSAKVIGAGGDGKRCNPLATYQASFGATCSPIPGTSKYIFEESLELE